MKSFKDPMIAPESALALGSDERKRRGAFYTPPDVVGQILDLTLQPILDNCGRSVGDLSALRVLDPSCGTGNFLVPAAERVRASLQRAGVPASRARAIAYGKCIVGIEINRSTVEQCVARLVKASRGAVSSRQMRRNILHDDALGLFATISEWGAFQEGVDAKEGFDLVIGNPPFLNQLATRTVRDATYTALLRQRLGSAVGQLTDTAVLFLLLAVESVKESGGVACQIVPISLLSARDAAPARASILARSGMSALWICEEKIFEASVRVCAPILLRGCLPQRLTLLHGRAFRQSGTVPAVALEEPTWARCLAVLKGVPNRTIKQSSIVRDVAHATAGFRDQYYGMRGCVLDLADADDSILPPLITSGLLDPAKVLWGQRPTKFAKQLYQFPRIDLDLLEPWLREWARRSLQPKLMLATQTKILEAVVDFEGRFIPSVPIITVTAESPALLWQLGALLSSPVVTQVAAMRHFGTALSSDALRLSASNVLDLPLPSDGDAWAEAAQHFQYASVARTDEERATELRESAKLMIAAFGLDEDPELLSWWTNRLPLRSRRGTS